jgi:hypothetical protein
VTTTAVILAALLAVAAVLWVARPFLRRAVAAEDKAVGDDAAARERTRLLEERDRALAALKELEFDNRTGKVSDADYRELVGPLRGEAAAAIAALDALTSGERPAGTTHAPAESVNPAVQAPLREEQPR